MKKFILISGVMFFTMLHVIAQTVIQETVITGTTLPDSNTVTNQKPATTFISSPLYNGVDKDYDYYRHQKKSNLTAGLVTLGSGLLMSGIGLIVSKNSKTIDDIENAAAATVLFIAGAASGIASIPLMIVAIVYGHKAKLELRKQKTGFGVPSNVDKNVTGITMTIPIGK